MDDREKPSSAFGLPFDFSLRYEGLFKRRILYNHGLLDILKTFKFESIDLYLPFIGAEMDRMCGTERKLETTQLFTGFVHLF